MPSARSSRVRFVRHIFRIGGQSAANIGFTCGRGRRHAAVGNHRVVERLEAELIMEMPVWLIPISPGLGGLGVLLVAEGPSLR